MALGLLLLVFLIGCQQPGTLPVRESGSRLVRALSQDEEGLPDRFQLRMGPFLFFSEKSLEGEKGRFEGLESLPGDLSRQLGLPTSQRMVRVYLFSDKEPFEEYVGRKYPLLPKRRAYFLAQKRAGGLSEELTVLTMDGPRLSQDLRHELTHALLHGVLRQVPLWLDEGIAEYFERDAADQGFNPSHWEKLQRQWSGGSRPDLQRLESLSQVQQMHREEYRESWLWVYWMLKMDPRGGEILREYLQHCRSAKTPRKLWEDLRLKFPDPNQALLEAMGQGDLPASVSRNPALPKAPGRSDLSP